MARVQLRTIDARGGPTAQEQADFDAVQRALGVLSSPPNAWDAIARIERAHQLQRQGHSPKRDQVDVQIDREPAAFDEALAIAERILGKVT
jgi:hypothetical protein